MAMDQKAWEAVEKAIVVSCLKLPNKGLGRREMLLGFVLKMKQGVVKVWMIQRKIWKEHMAKLMNVENERSDSIDASKVEDVVWRI